MKAEPKGIDLFEIIIDQGGDYAQTVKTAFSEIGEDLFVMLEKAEREGKKISIESKDDNVFDPEIIVSLK